MKAIVKKFFEEFAANIDFPTIIYTYESGKIITYNNLARDILGTDITCVYQINGTQVIPLQKMQKKNGSNIFYNREYSLRNGITTEIDLELNVIPFDGKHVIVDFFDYSYKQAFVRHMKGFLPRLAWKDTKENFLGLNQSLLDDLQCLRTFSMPAKTADMVDSATSIKLTEDDNYVCTSKEPKMNTLQLMKADGTEGYFCSISRIPLINSNGSVAGLIGSYHLIFDRTEYKEAYNSIIFRNNILSRLVCRSDTVILSFHKSSKYHLDFISTNVNLYGYNNAQFYSKKVKFANIVEEEDYKRLKSFLENYRTGKEKYYITNVTIRMSSGQSVVIKVNINIIKEDLDDMYFVCIVQRADGEEENESLVKKGRYHLRLDSWETINQEQQLAKAITERCREFSVYYQPIVRLDNTSIVGVEALLRWNNPSLGEVKPLDFLSMSEYLGLMGQLGDFVLKDVVKTFAQIRKCGNGTINMHVNISMMQLFQPDFMKRLCKLMDTQSIPRNQIVFELKEGLAIEDIELMRKAILEIKKEGFSLALDNFGAGFVDVHNIMDMPFDYIKLDKKFMESYGTEKFNGALVAAMLDIIKSMKAQVIVEGVETLQQYEFLLFHEVQAYQGFYHSKPLNREKLLELLNSK